MHYSSRQIIAVPDIASLIVSVCEDTVTLLEQEKERGKEGKGVHGVAVLEKVQKVGGGGRGG